MQVDIGQNRPDWPALGRSSFHPPPTLPRTPLLKPRLVTRRTPRRLLPCFASSLRCPPSPQGWSPITPSLQSSAYLLTLCAHPLLHPFCRPPNNPAPPPPIHLL